MCSVQHTLAFENEVTDRPLIISSESCSIPHPTPIPSIPYLAYGATSVYKDGIILKPHEMSADIEYDNPVHSLVQHDLGDAWLLNIILAPLMSDKISPVSILNMITRVGHSQCICPTYFCERLFNIVDQPRIKSVWTQVTVQLFAPTQIQQSRYYKWSEFGIWGNVLGAPLFQFCMLCLVFR